MSMVEVKKKYRLNTVQDYADCADRHAAEFKVLSLVSMGSSTYHMQRMLHTNFTAPNHIKYGQIICNHNHWNQCT